MLVTVNGITHFYGSRLILKDISFELAAHSITLLIGPNGAGKTTLMQIIAGLTVPTSGSVTFNQPQQHSQQQQIGYLGHQTFVYPELTASENLQFWTKLHKIDASKTAIADMLERVDLLPFAQEKAKHFSRGMTQRLNIARVLLQQPQLLLLDEPSTGLDTRSTTILHNEIVALRKQTTAILWITHALEHDQSLADNILYIAHKKCQYFGSAQHFSTMNTFADTTSPTKTAEENTNV